MRRGEGIDGQTKWCVHVTLQLALAWRSALVAELRRLSNDRLLD